jgi:putative membrane protein
MQGGTLARGFLGGILMGLANLIPGVSGGTMLVATGVYGHFVNAVARLSTFRFHLQPLLILGVIVLGAVLAIFAGAGTMSMLIVESRWVMYSLFIGLTLGGVPLLWSKVRPPTQSATIGIAAGIIAMIVIAGLESAGTGAITGNSGVLMLLITGAAAGAAMVLPGVSGSYLLLVLGQYLLILNAIEALRSGEFSSAMEVIIPVGIGVVIGVVVISNIVSWLLRRVRDATLGVLLGLLIGAVFGLWPFRATRQPIVGDFVQGRLIETSAQAETIEPSKWPMESFAPSFGMIVGAIALALIGFVISLAISRLGRNETM